MFKRCACVHMWSFKRESLYFSHLHDDVLVLVASNTFSFYLGKCLNNANLTLLKLRNDGIFLKNFSALKRRKISRGLVKTFFFGNFERALKVGSKDFFALVPKKRAPFYIKFINGIT